MNLEKVYNDEIDRLWSILDVAYDAGNVLCDEIDRLRSILEALIRDPRVPVEAIEAATCVSP